MAVGSGGGDRFREALPALGTLRDTAVYGPAIMREGEQAIRFAGRLLEYREYLARARAYKARRPAASEDIDREVLAQARAAVADARGFSLAGLRIVRTMDRGGALDRLVNSWRTAVQAAGSVAAVDEWNHVLQTASAQDAFSRLQVSEPMIRAMGEAIDSVGAVVTATEQKLIVEGTVGGRRVTGSLDATPRPARPSGVIDLLTRGRIDRLVDLFEREEPAHLEGVPADMAEGVRVPEVAAFAALETYREVVRHIRKLEDTGLATYQGSEPATIVGIIVGALLFIALIGAIMSEIYCDDNDPTGQPTECTIGRVLFFLGVALLAALGAGAISQSGSGGNTLVMGGRS